MSDSTSIFDLPVDPAGGGNNMSLSANEKIGNSPNTNYVPDIPQIQQGNGGSGVGGLGGVGGNGLSLDQTTINSIVNGLQQASASGATLLPSRDIPQNQEQITRDPQIQPNYIPSTEIGDYIDHHEQNDEIVGKYQNQERNTNSLDAMYDELQTPLLLCVLFFLFQLPFFKKYLFIYVPGLFLKDGNYNIYGFVFMSIFFALVYYVLSKSSLAFNRF